MPIYNVKLPGKDWEWETEWEVVKELLNSPEELKKAHHDGKYDPEGWQYATDFTSKFRGHGGFSDVVRKRRWQRTCVQKKINKDGTPEKYQDEKISNKRKDISSKILPTLNINMDESCQ